MKQDIPKIQTKSAKVSERLGKNCVGMTNKNVVLIDSTPGLNRINIFEKCTQQTTTCNLKRGMVLNCSYCLRSLCVLIK